MQDQPIVLFDGVCNFCSSSVKFVIDRNAREDIVFCQIQSQPGQKLLAEYGLSELGLTSMILLYRGQAFIKSSAALRIARLMDMPWPLLSVFLVIPPFIRHRVYDWIGRHRYRWFGKRDACWLPGTDIQRRFLS